MPIPSRKGLIPFVIGIILITALLAYGGIKSISTREAVFRQRGGSISKTSSGASRTIRGTPAVVSGTGLLIIAAGVVMLGVLVLRYQIRGRITGGETKPMPFVIALWVVGSILTFAPASCSFGTDASRSLPPTATK